MAGFWRRVPLLLLTLTVFGAAAPVSYADRSLRFQDLGPVLTGPGLGLPPGQGVTRPTAAVLPDGRVRVYFSATGMGASGMYSAISPDGVHFTMEPGLRLNYGTSAHIQPLPDGRWRLYVVQNDMSGVPIGIGSWISDDGLSFAHESGLRLAHPLPGGRVLRCCGLVQLPDARYRMYVGANEFSGIGSPPMKFYSAISSDLFDWTLEPGIRLTVSFSTGPTALLNPDQSTMLVFHSVGGIKTAVSADGLTFGAITGTNITADADDPTVVSLPSGQLLIYYSVFDPDMIKAAIATRISPPVVGYAAPPVTAITATRAVLSGVVDPQGADTTYAFEYGTSIPYSDSTTYGSIPGTSAQTAVSATLTGLRPGTTYHFRIKALNQPGETDGADQTFSTPLVVHCVVPKVVGRTLRRVKRAIVAHHCTPGRIRHRASARRKGIVIAQSPAPGTVRRRNAKVNLIVSAGRRRHHH